jgi:serine/threonine protein kinase
MQSTSKAAANDSDVTAVAIESRESKELSLEAQIARDIEPAYKFVKLCGRGSQGLVFKALHTKTNTQVAIKKVDNIFRHPGMARRYLRELQIMV